MTLAHIDVRPVVLVDGLNVFMQMYHAFHCTSTDGQEYGGTAGFLISLNRYVKNMMPSNVYVIWEHGRSPTRQAIYTEYKQNRKKYDGEAHNNKTNQLLQLVRILYHTPVCQVFISKCEGDDVIARLCNDNFKEHKKIIVSTDKDFYQLLDDNTTIYSPVTKVYVNSHIVKHKYNIAAENFAIYKALNGDPSDNIKGIKGLGQKRILKFFPDMKNKKLCLNDIRNLCLEKQDTNKAYLKILNDFNNIETNLSIIQLQNTLLTDEQINTLNDIIKEHRPTLNYEKFIHSLIACGFSINHESLIESMTHLCNAY